MEARKLRLLAKQAVVRRQVEVEQHEIMGMGERAYRKMARWSEQLRKDAGKQVNSPPSG